MMPHSQPEWLGFGFSARAAYHHVVRRLLPAMSRAAFRECLSLIIYNYKKNCVFSSVGAFVCIFTCNRLLSHTAAALLQGVAKCGPIFHNFRMSDLEHDKCTKYVHNVSFMELFCTHNSYNIWAGEDYAETLIEPEILDR